MENKVFFENSKGNKLSGILNNPSGDKSKPIIILVHGFNSGKDSGTNTALKELFNKINVSSFRIDLFAHGESGGDFEYLTVSEAVDDIMRAIGFLKDQGYQKIGLIGSSFGGLAAYIAASKSPDLYLLAVKCPVASYLEFRDYTNQEIIDEWKDKGFVFRENKKLRYSFYKDAKKNIAYDIAKNIKVPTLIVHGDKDLDVPIAQSIKMSLLIPDCRLVTIKGASHRFLEKNTKKEMVSAIINFIVEKS